MIATLTGRGEASMAAKKKGAKPTGKPAPEQANRGERKEFIPTRYDREFVKNLKILMERHNLTQPKLARKSGVGQTTISDWLRFKRGASWAKALRVAEALGEPIEILAGRRPSLDPLEQSVIDSWRDLGPNWLAQVNALLIRERNRPEQESPRAELVASND